MEKILDFYNSQANETAAHWNETARPAQLTFDGPVVKGPGGCLNALVIFLIYLLALPSLWLCWFSITKLMRHRGLIATPEADQIMEELRSVTALRSPTRNNPMRY